ncbi:MAG: DUF998 domain-containing protein [Promethearchaeota archaeon]
MKLESRIEWLSRISLFGSLQFIIITFIAMLFYPGGTYIDPNISGYSFFSNYFSDLGNTIAYSGENNLISFVLFSITLSIFALSYLLFFINAVFLFKENKLEKKLSLIGLIFAAVSAISLIGVVFTPQDLYFDEHNLFAASAFLWALLPCILYSIILYLNDKYPKKYALPFIIFAIALVVFMVVVLLGPSNQTPEGLIIQVTLQKIVLYLWCISLAIGSFKNLKIEQT